MSTENVHSIEGRIFFDYRLPAGGLTVRSYHRGFGCTETLLGETKTGNDGSFRLVYTPGTPLTNLEIRALDERGEEVAISATRYGAKRQEFFNLVSPARVRPLRPEYERLRRDLINFIRESGDIGEARENSQCQDISLLHRGTRWDARLISLLALSARLSRETNLEEIVLYALLRTGLPSKKELLAHVRVKSVEKALNKAVEANIVSLNAEQITAAKRAFEQFARVTRRTAKATGAPSSFGELLDQSGLTTSERTTFENLYFSHGESAEDLWTRAAQRGIPEPKIKRLQLQGKLAYLTLNNAALAEAIRGDIDSPEKLGALIDEDLYKEDEWKKRLTSLAGSNESELAKLIPPAYKGETTNDRLQAYASDLARKVRRALPTRMVARMIETDELHLGAQHASLKPAVSAVLKKAESLGFSLGRVPVNTFVAQHQEKLFEGIDDKEVEPATEAFKRLHRLYQITPTDQALQLALNEGFRSAADVSSIPYELYMANYADKFSADPKVSAGIADLLYRKSQEVASVTYNFFMGAKQMETAPTVYALSAPAPIVEAAKNELIKHYPTMESLFGSLDFCECEACRSVLSPAAYLVDLLQFLNPADPAWNSFLNYWKLTHNGDAYTAEHLKAYDALVERRPDIPHLPLTCENTHTVLPYIDVVNEILEYYVAQGSLDSTAVHDTGEAVSDDLLAEPQNILKEAYDKLLEAQYPIGLPFDLWLETVRGFCSHFGLPLWQLLDLFRSTESLFSAPGDVSDVFIEYLNISPAELAIITNPDPQATWHLLFGFDDQAKTAAQNQQDALSALASAKTLSRQLGVTYKEMAELVSTGFVNPELNALVILKKLGVEVSDVFTYKNNEQLLNQVTLTQEEAVLVEELKAFKAKLEEFTTTYPGFNAVAWLDQSWQTNVFDKVLVLADPDTGCNFDLTTLRYADGTSVDPLALIKLNLFVRLWKNLGWTIEEMDRALQAFLPSGSLPLTTANLGEALKTALIYLSQFKRLDETVKVGSNRRLKLLTLWSNLPTTGSNPLYAQLFLTKNALKQDTAFDEPLGNYLSQSGVLIKDHLLALQAGLSLTSTEITSILTDSQQQLETAVLSLENVSMLYRYALLAKALKLSVQDLITLKSLSGIDPFKPLEAGALSNLEDVYPFTHTLRFVDAAAAVKESGFNVEDLDYFFRHRFDPVGKYQQNPDEVLTLVKNLAAELKRIRDEQTISGSLTDDQLRQKFALLLTPDVLTAFFSAITGTAEAESLQDNVALSDKLDPKSFAGEPHIRVTYNGVAEQQRLSWRGLLLDGKKNELKSANPSAATLLDNVQPLGFANVASQIESVLTSLISTAEYHAFVENVQSADSLDPEDFKGEPSVRVAYDEERSIQHLTWRGLLLKPRKEELQNEIPSPVLVQLLDSVYSQAMSEAESLISASLAILTSTLEFQAVEEQVQLADKLDANKFDTRFSVTYEDASPWDSATEYQIDDVVSFNGQNWIALAPNTDVEPGSNADWSGAQGRKQTLSVRGLLSQTKIDELLAANNQSLVLAALLTNVQSQTNAVLQQLRVGLFTDVNPANDPADPDDFDTVFAELPSLIDVVEDPRARLAKAVVPFIIRHLTTQLIVQTLSSELDANPDLIKALLTDGSLLVDPSQPGSTLMDAFASAGDKGTSATFFASVNGSGNPLEIKVVPSVDTLGKPALANSARFEGYLQVPSAGPYRFFALSDAAASEIELRLGDLPDPLLLATAQATNAEFSAFIELKQGLPNIFTFYARNLNGGRAQLFVQGEKLPKGALSQLSLSPSQSVERVSRAMVLLKKTLDIINGLALTEREVRHLLTHVSDFGSISLNKLPTGETDSAQSQDGIDLFAHFLRLVQYARLKRDIAGDTDDLITIFENARRALPTPVDPTAQADLFVDLCLRFAELTRRDSELVQEAATKLGFNNPPDPGGGFPAFAQEKDLWRLWDVLRAVETFGVGVQDLVNSTQIIDTTKTPAERFTIAINLRNIVKAKYETENWRRIAQPIFDKLRQRQRDALVAWIMHHDNFERIEQLFEFFLIDPGMEPVVQTSRLRLAISSVQLFIQRSLLNLELKVDPSAINASHWQWMKRYRVWEANRKIFLFPENWLEPEFRDDKTHLFNELESALLEGDVSADLVEAGFFNYLKNLEELARLRIVAVYSEEKPLDPASNVVHVVGRTFNLPHKYFYRRYQYGMWTPWQPMPIEIDGHHVVLVIWQQRLHFFWVTFMEKAKQDTSGETINVKNGNVEINKAPPRMVDIQLNWSEYYQGQWTTRESSGYATPVTVNIARNFDKREVFIFSLKEYDENGEESALRIQLSGEINVDGFGDGAQFIANGKWKTAFRIISKHSAPEIVSRQQTQPLKPPYSYDSARTNHYKGSGSLDVTFIEEIVDDGVARPESPYITKKILRKADDYSFIVPGDVPRLVSQEFAHLINPFFFQDKQHTFFVEPTLTEKTFVEWEDWVIQVPVPEFEFGDIVLIPDVPEWVDPGGPVEFDPLSIYEFNTAGDWITSQQTLLQYDEAWVGNTGGINVQMLPAMDTTAIEMITNIGSNFIPTMIGAGGISAPALNKLKSNGIVKKAAGVGGKLANS